MILMLECAECGAELEAVVRNGHAIVYPCACQKPKPKKEYEPVFLEAKGIGGLPHD